MKTFKLQIISAENKNVFTTKNGEHVCLVQAETVQVGKKKVVDLLS